ncbi:hypothetical protein FACS189449_02770 [Alphaproteobacteria bacterium]|nr:hypothetical protein FACS189449_02770 [Alphaproteobacteria bacterium]
MAQKGYHHVTRDIRSQIQVLKSSNLSQRKIAEKVGISQSAVSREIAKNSSGCEYSTKIADKKAIERRSLAVNVPKKPKGNLELKIRECTEKDWSPEQISGRLKCLLYHGRSSLGCKDLDKVLLVIYHQSNC